MEEEQCCGLDIEFERPWKNPMEEKYIGYQIRMLDRMIGKRVMKRISETKIDGMTRLADWILEYLVTHEQDNIYQKDIERLFEIGKSTIAGSMKVLEKNGLIERKAVEGDARLKQICCTSNGKAHIQMIKESKQEFERQLVKGIPQDELNLFLATLQKMQNNMKEQEGR